nr:hypothetical protein [Methylomagnum ishizawai]
MVAIDAPLAKMFAVVREDGVALFTDPRPSTLDNGLADIHGSRMPFKVIPLPAGELGKRYFFDRASSHPIGQSRIVNYPSTADVDAMVRIASAGCD